MEVFDAQSGETYVVEGNKDFKLKGSGAKLNNLEGTLLLRISEVGEYFANPYGKIHGGAMVTWLDCLTSLAIFAFDKSDRMESVSLNMTADFMNAASQKPLLFKVIVRKIGKMIAFTECEILDEKFKLLASCTHKKAFINAKVMAKL